jgi:phosphoribosylglycinamide formyltransferase-1
MSSGVASLPLVVFVSGSGSNLQAILDAIEAKTLDAQVRLVVSNKPGVRALERAAAAGVPTCVRSHRDFPSREAFDAELAKEAREALGDGGRSGLVVLAGFMRLLTPTFLTPFRDRVINIHPALLPAFPGTHAQKQALDYGVAITGCTVHLVDTGTDTGRILAQAAVPVLPDDDEESLTARILRREHQLFPTVLQWLATGALRIVDGQPVYDGVSPSVGVEASGQAAG